MEDSQELMDLDMEETFNTRVKKPEEALKLIKEISHANFKREICGFIGSGRETGEYIVQQEENIAPDPSSHFLINPLNYLLFKDTYDMVAIFHSHILGDESESEFDVKMANNCCQAFLIYGINTKKINIYSPKNIEGNVKVLERIKELV